MGGENQGPLKRLAFVSSIGISMVLATFIGLYIGIKLDDFFSTKPWLTIIFLLFGIAAGFRNIYVLIKKYGG
ncbi:MAG: AtpZ/AtpI family protein [Deltaproteobacteria bacterium]|nr:AtpZ/AtpI family protein [Deltaproteobacteria bacterium]